MTTSSKNISNIKPNVSGNDPRTNDAIIVEEFVRAHFKKHCWINEIIQIILQFYMSKGGSLFMFGNGEGGGLGIEEYNDKLCKEPTLCRPFHKMNVLDVSTDGHTLILDVDGKVWSCGYGKNGQLGNGKEENLSTPQKLKLIQPVIAVAAGGRHSLILLKNGNVQSFGRGLSGQLGHGSDKNLLVPKTIEALTKYKIIQIEAGDAYSACLTKDGDLFCFGSNEYGQCGVGKEKGEKIMTPTKIKFAEKVFLVACGYEHTLLITSDDLIYSFGNGGYGRLGHGSKENKYIPTWIDGLKKKKIKICAVGWYHSICIDEEGKVWSFGENDIGQCGLGTDIWEQLTPEEIEYFVCNNIVAKDCAAGDEHSCVISEDGSLYIFGNNKTHQLGFEKSCCYYVPEKLSFFEELPVKKVSMGFEYTAVITE